MNEKKLESIGFKHSMSFDAMSTKVHHWHKGLLMITRVDSSWTGKFEEGKYYTRLSIINNEHPIYPVTAELGHISWDDLVTLDRILNKTHPEYEKKLAKHE